MSLTAEEIDSKLKQLRVMYPFLKMIASEKVPQGDIIMRGLWIVNPEDLDHYIKQVPYYFKSEVSRVI